MATYAPHPQYTPDEPRSWPTRAARGGGAHARARSARAHAPRLGHRQMDGGKLGTIPLVQSLRLSRSSSYTAMLPPGCWLPGQGQGLCHLVPTWPLSVAVSAGRLTVQFGACRPSLQLQTDDVIVAVSSPFSPQHGLTAATCQTASNTFPRKGSGAHLAQHASSPGTGVTVPFSKSDRNTAYATDARASCPSVGQP